MPATEPFLNQENLFECWRTPRGYRAIVAWLVVVALLAGAGTVVYVGGGTSAVWPHLMYVPILLAAAAFRLKGAIVAAIASGLILGPFMPLDTFQDIPQNPANWIYRLGFFLIFGVLAGLLSRRLNQELDRTRYQSLYDDRTGLPNLLSLEQALASGLQQP